MVEDDGEFVTIHQWCMHTTNVGIWGATRISPAQCKKESEKGQPDCSYLSQNKLDFFNYIQVWGRGIFADVLVTIYSERLLNRTVIVVSLCRLRETSNRRGGKTWSGEGVILSSSRWYSPSQNDVPCSDSFMNMVYWSIVCCVEGSKIRLLVSLLSN